MGSLMTGLKSSQKEQEKKKNNGDAGYRSPCPSHAKRMLYHLSYIPVPKLSCLCGNNTHKNYGKHIQVRKRNKKM